MNALVVRLTLLFEGTKEVVYFVRRRRLEIWEGKVLEELASAADSLRLE